MGAPELPGRGSSPDDPPAGAPWAGDELAREGQGQGDPADRGSETMDWSNRGESASVPPPGTDTPMRGRSTGAPGGAPRVLDIETFVQSLIESGLMEAAEVREFLGRFPEGEGPTGAEPLARELIRARRLTEYQAGAILQGKTKGLLIGSYRILDKLGAGGMGMVFRAEHRLMKRVVALKLLPPSFTRDESNVARFRRESEAVARLSHPNVVAALDAGEFRGLHFFVMEYVEGRDLDRHVKEEGTMAVDQALTCLIQAARGLQAAHARGVYHRDIKPSNLLMDLGGTVKVLDLGLARMDKAPGSPVTAEDEGALTRNGDVMGTVDYMPPEQALDSRSADARSDIYSLGCTLYYLLVGKPPYSGRSLIARILAHREHPIPRLREARPEIPPALDAVLGRMMAKKPEERYQSIGELIDVLEVCRTNAAGSPPGEIPAVPEPAETEPISPPDPRPWARRPAAMVALAAGGAALIGIGLVLPRLRPSKSPVPAVGPGARAIVKAEGKGEPGRPPSRAEPEPEPVAVAPALESAPNPEPVVAPKVQLDLSRPVVEVQRFRVHSQRLVESVDVSDDGRFAVSAGNDQTVRYWEVARGAEIRGFRHEGPVFAVTFSPDGRTALSASGDRTARIWDVGTGREVGRFAGHHQAVYCAAYSPDGRRALTGGHDDAARLWEVADGSEVQRFPHAGPVVAVAFSPDGRSALTASGKTMTLWDVATGTASFEHEGYADVLCVAFSADGHRGLSGAGDGTMTFWDLDRGIPIRVVEEPGNWVRCVGFLPGDAFAMAGTQNGNLILWDLATDQAVPNPVGKAAHLGLAIVPDGSHALTADDDGFVRLWKLP